MVSYAGCKQTEVTSGILAQIRNPGRTGAKVAQCVQRAVHRLCTRRQQHATMYKVAEAPEQMGQTARRILDRVEMFSADGASNEQLAGRLLYPFCGATQRRQEVAELDDGHPGQSARDPPPHSADFQAGRDAGRRADGNALWG